MLNRSLIIFLVALFMSGCDLINPDEDIPIYITINSVDLATLPDQGSSSDNFTDAWINHNGNILGVFELPCTFPIIGEQPNNIKIRAGIKENGISASRKYYSFTDSFDTTISSSDNSIIINPVVSYNENCDFIHIEDFEQSNISINGFDKNQSSMYGNYCGNWDFSESKHEIDRLFPIVGFDKTIFLELDYANNTKFTVGIKGYNASSNETTYPLVTINSSENEWKKIYINISNTLNQNANILYYAVYLQAENEEQEMDASIMLDNIKIISI